MKRKRQINSQFPTQLLFLLHLLPKKLHPLKKQRLNQHLFPRQFLLLKLLLRKLRKQSPHPRKSLPL